MLILYVHTSCMAILLWDLCASAAGRAATACWPAPPFSARRHLAAPPSRCHSAAPPQPKVASEPRSRVESQESRERDATTAELRRWSRRTFPGEEGRACRRVSGFEKGRGCAPPVTSASPSSPARGPRDDPSRQCAVPRSRTRRELPRPPQLRRPRSQLGPGLQDAPSLTPTGELASTSAAKEPRAALSGRQEPGIDRLQAMASRAAESGAAAPVPLPRVSGTGELP
jgi:hypothetical protein